jgi:hypothetical protein
MESQCKRILKILKSGKKVTSMDGFMMGIVRLTNRVNELRSPEGGGHQIQDKWIKSKSGRRYKIYFMRPFFDAGKISGS